MTLKELQELEDKGKRVFEVLESVAQEFKNKTNLPIDVKKDLNLFGSGKPCFWINHNNKEIFYFRNVLMNPRQPSPIFMKIDSENEKELLELINKSKEKIEFAQGLKVNYHLEKEV